MSYSFDRSRAVSLSNQGGVWSLEVEELVRLNRNIFRPRRQRLSGRDAILQHLAMNQDVLLRETQQLLEVHVGEDSFHYELRGSAWVPVPAKRLVEDIEQQAAAAKQETELTTEVSELKERLASLESSVSRVHAQLEQLLARGFAPAQATEAAPPAAPKAVADSNTSDAESEAGPQPQPQPVATAEHVEGIDVAEAAEVAEPAVAAEPEVEAGPQALPAPPEPDFPPMQLPTVDALTDMVRGLIGDEAGLTGAPTEDWDLRTDKTGYLSLLSDDAGEVVGAIMMDLEATVRLAGGMLMEEEEVLDAQIEAEEPSSDIMDTAGEVLNTLCSSVNKIKGNPHVRVGDLQSIDASEHPWLCYSRKRDDFLLSVGGRLAVFAR